MDGQRVEGHDLKFYNVQMLGDIGHTKMSNTVHELGFLIDDTTGKHEWLCLLGSI